MEQTTPQYYEAALGMLNTPFRHRGRTRNGIDCVGLAILAARSAGWANDIQEPRVYGRRPWRDGLREFLRLNFGVWFKPEERALQLNDTLLFHRPKSSGPSHVGIVCPHPHGLGLVHTYGEIGRVVYHIIDQTWYDQIVEVYPWPEKY